MNQKCLWLYVSGKPSGIDTACINHGVRLKGMEHELESLDHLCTMGRAILPEPGHEILIEKSGTGYVYSLVAKASSSIAEYTDEGIDHISDAFLYSIGLTAHPKSTLPKPDTKSETDEDHYNLPWPSIEEHPLMYPSGPGINGVIYQLDAEPPKAAKHRDCEDCQTANAGTCDPVMTDNRRYHICDGCCEKRRQNKNWQPPKGSAHTALFTSVLK